MAGESGNGNFDSPRDEVISVPDVITNLVADTAISGIPGPVRRNFFKALGQLCSATIDIPVAYLTGIADERRAETEARIKLINTSAEQIAQQMQTDPEYARLAVQKFGQRVIREQVNLDLISQKAATELRDASDSIDQSGSDESGETISDDWLNSFETEARQKNTEEMQTFFAKILAGEIRKPGSYSTKTIKILGSLDQNIANHFVKLCSLSISIHSQDMRVPSLGGNAGSNALQEYGLNFDTLNLLNEHGLVISDYNSWREHMPCVALPGGGQQAVFFPFGYRGRHWILMPMSNDRIGQMFRIEGVALTQSGRELSRIVNIEPMDQYSTELAQYFERNGFRMIEVSDGQPCLSGVNTVTENESQ